MNWTDENGQPWELVYLRRGTDVMFETTPWDATHRGFRSGHERRLYEFRMGDDRGNARSAIAAQFACARKTLTVSQAIARRGFVPSTTRSRGDAVQDLFELRRRGMGPR